MRDNRRKCEDYRTYQRIYLERFESLQDLNVHGPQWLHCPDIAKLVLDSVRYRDGKEYELLACCIMPNHVHILFTKPLFRILQSLKRHTAREANKILQRSGTFWQDESYDHVVRNREEKQRLFWYVLFNPVKAGLVESWEEWPWSWFKEELANM